MSEVSELLVRSMALHHQAKPVSTGKGSGRLVSKTRDLTKLREAYELRKQAHELDPEHADEAWQAEQAGTPTGRDTHAQMMAFYRDQGLDG